MTCAWVAYYAVEVFLGAIPSLLTLVILAILLVSLIRAARVKEAGVPAVPSP